MNSKHIVFFLVLIISGVMVAKPPKMPKPVKGTWVEPAKPKVIYGNWKWIETNCCGLRNGISNPTSTADSITLVLLKDNTFDEQHTKKNALPRSGNFLLFKDAEHDMVQFNDERPARYTLSASGDTLTISWKYLELQSEKYIRAK